MTRCGPSKQEKKEEPSPRQQPGNSIYFLRYNLPMNTQTIAINMFVAVTTSVVTALIVSFFAVRTALKQFRVQRAFERRLDWYEKTTQAIFEFLHLNEPKKIS